MTNNPQACADCEYNDNCPHEKSATREWCPVVRTRADGEARQLALFVEPGYVAEFVVGEA